MAFCIKQGSRFYSGSRVHPWTAYEGKARKWQTQKAASAVAAREAEKAQRVHGTRPEIVVCDDRPVMVCRCGSTDPSYCLWSDVAGPCVMFPAQGE